MDGAPRVHTTTGLGYRRDIAVVFLYGEHDYGSRAMLETELAPLVGTVVVDLSWCAFLDSSIISIILSKHTQLEREGGHLEVIIPPTQEHLANLFGVLGLQGTLDVRDAQRPLG